MWTTIAYKLAQEGDSVVRIYLDETEMSFLEQTDATAYAAYLIEKGQSNVEMYEKTPVASGGLDIIALKKTDALNKLTQLERDILGV